MTLSTAYWCVLIAALLPYVWIVVAKTGGTERFDNHNPRAWLARQNAPRVQRGTAAQFNGFEAFPAFAAGVIIAQLAGVAHDRIAWLALIFVVFRVLHGVFYLLDRAPLRSLAWFAAFACTLTLIVQAALLAARSAATG